MPLAIEDYALIGDCHTGALVGLDGNIDWLCLPRFDSPSTFGALLGDAEQGHWRLAPAGAEVATSRAYRPDTVVLVMTERRPWDATREQFKQIEEKLNRYMGYVLDGFLAEQYPQYRGKSVQIRLDCAEAPHGEAVRFVAAMTHATQSHGIHFSIAVRSPAS